MMEGIYKIVWTGLPIPPSINSCYATIMRGGRPIRIKTREYHAFDSACAVWMLENLEMVRTTIKHIKGETLRNRKLQLHWNFIFPQAKLLCKDGSTKRLDVTNRIKVAEDVVCKILEIDDKHVWSGSYSKSIAKGEGKTICTIEVLQDASL
jgi:hypothetical protein